MNRKERRSASRAAKVLTELKLPEINDWVKEGDKVRLDIKRITERNDFAGLQDDYKEFVKNSADTIYTARIYRYHKDIPILVELAEAPKWLFWVGDVIKISGGEA